MSTLKVNNLLETVGTVLPTGRNDLTCHVNTSSSNIADDGISYPYSGFPVIGSTSSSFGDFDEAFDDDFPFDQDLGNAVDPFEEDFNTSITDDQTGTDPLQEGTTLTASGAACVGGKVCWYKYKRISSICNGARFLPGRKQHDSKSCNPLI